MVPAALAVLVVLLQVEAVVPEVVVGADLEVAAVVGSAAAAASA